MSRAPEMFGLVRHPLLRCDACMFRHRFGNRSIQTTVENVELLDRHRGAMLLRERCNRLADVAVVVDHLRECETGLDQLRAMLGGGRSDGIGGKWCLSGFESECLGELLQKKGNAMLELVGRDRRPKRSPAQF